MLKRGLPGCNKSPVRLPRAIENSLGQSEVRSALPEWAIKILSRELSVNWNFVIIFDISTVVYNILFQNRSKVTPLTSFAGSMSQREGAIRFYKQYFNQHQMLGLKVGHDGAIDLHCQVAPSGCPMGLPLEKKLSWPGDYMYPSHHFAITRGGQESYRTSRIFLFPDFLISRIGKQFLTACIASSAWTYITIHTCVC